MPSSFLYLLEGSGTMIQDSGNRREFESGAVRDISEGKGRCDLLPLDVVAALMNAPVLRNIELFKEKKDSLYLFDAIVNFIDGHNKYWHISSAMLDISKHFEDGAKKYGDNNWKKGIPLHCYIDSGVRHFLKHSRGDTDERHDLAFMWNIMCAIWTFNNKPELDDIEQDLKPQ